MTTIAFTASKGGVGKTTLCLLIGTELAAQGSNVLILDADPQHSAVKWGNRTRKAGRLPDNLSIEQIDTEKDLADRISDYAADVVLIDVQGALNQFQTIAIVAADIAIVPTQMTMISIVEAVALFNYAKALRRAPLRLLLNGVKGIDANSPAFREALGVIREHRFPAFRTIIRSRNIYEQFSGSVGTLASLATEPGKQEQVDKARANIRDLLVEITELVSAQDDAA